MLFPQKLHEHFYDGQAKLKSNLTVEFASQKRGTKWI